MIDFAQITQSTSKYNFHSHTQFCDGRDVMEAFVLRAIELGYEHYGFSPHSPIPIDSPCNMKAEQVGDYIDEVYRLKTKYGNHIHLYTSMEIDFLDEWGPSHPFFKGLPLEYRIGSVHFIPSLVNPGEYVDIDGRYENFKVKMNQSFNDDIEYVVRTYYDQSLKLIEAGGFDIIAHCDKIGHNSSCHKPGIENEPWYNELVIRNLEAIMDHGYIIEINTKAFHQHGRFFPNTRYFSLLKKWGVQVVFNSDAHFPDLIDAGRNEAIKAYL